MKLQIIKEYSTIYNSIRYGIYRNGTPLGMGSFETFDDAKKVFDQIKAGLAIEPVITLEEEIAD
jgi:hypothetical protein